MKRLIALIAWGFVLSSFVLAAGCQPTAPGAPGSSGVAPAAPASDEKLPDSEIAAWVNGKPISNKRVDEMIAQMPPFMVAQLASPEGRKTLVDNLVAVELVYAKANSDGFANRPEIQEKIRELSKHLIYAEYVKNHIASQPKLPPPDDAAVKKFFDERPELANANFDQVKDQIREHLSRSQEQEQIEKFVSGLRAGAEVKYNESLTAPPPAMPMMPGGPGAPEGEMPGAPGTP